MTIPYEQMTWIGDLTSYTRYRESIHRGEILGLLPTGQHHVIERMREPAFAHPVAFLDDESEHHRELAGRTTETGRGDPCPRPGRLS